MSLWLPGGEYYLLITSISARKKYLSPVWYILIPFMFYYIRGSNKRLDSILTNTQDKKGIPYRPSLPPTKMPCYLYLYQIQKCFFCFVFVWTGFLRIFNWDISVRQYEKCTSGLGICSVCRSVDFFFLVIWFTKCQLQHWSHKYIYCTRV